MFDVRSFYEDHSIEYKEGDDHHKHCRPGWVQAECPRCSGNPGYHLGFSEHTGQFVCWRCGFMPITEAIRRQANVSWPEAKRILKRYGGVKEYHRYESKPKERNIEVEFPLGTLDYFPKKHRHYLEDRGFDPDRLIDIWDLRATGTAGEYRYRIIAPIYHNNRLMSYQGRAVANNSPPYMACPMSKERRDHKHCLYGLDMVVGRSVLVLEGITDVWRMGIGSVATFGIKYTDVQAQLLADYFDNIFVMFDETEEEAQNKAKELVLELSLLGKHSEHITLGIDHDPAELSEKDARYVMRELLIA